MNTAARAVALPVRVSGMGIVSAIGHDIAGFTQALQLGRSGIISLPATEPANPVGLGAPIIGFDLNASLDALAGLPSALLRQAAQLGRRAPFPIQVSIAAALQAWRQAGLHQAAIDPERVGIVIAGHNTTQNLQFSLDPGYRAAPDYLSPRFVVQAMDSHQLGILSEILNIQGEGFVAGGASASGNIGILHGMRMVQAGLADICLVVGVAADLSPMDIQGFHNIGAMGGKHFAARPEQACRPFDAAAEGFIPGQAAACLVLENPHSAHARSAADLGELLGGAIALHATASPDPDAAGEARAMRQALARSGYAPQDIAYVNTHGTASPRGDAAEIAAIADVFGEHFPAVWLNATKGLTGHCLNAAGVVEAIACLLQMQHGFLHGNQNLDTPIDPQARFCGAEAVAARPALALSNSFGFGGINTSLLLQYDQHAT